MRRAGTVVEARIDAHREHVFALLSDPARYADWVVGASRIRGADLAFPAVGTRFRHTQGIGRVGVHDETVVLAVREPTHLRLKVEARPVIRAEVDLRLLAVGAATHVVMTETVVGGVQRLLPPAVNDLLLGVRNHESLRRLRRLAER